MTEKRFNVFDVDGTIFLEDHKEGSYHIGEIGNVNVNCLNDIANRLNELHDEKQQLLSANTKLTEENTNILSTIRTAYQNERTNIGRMVLKQLLDNLE